MNSRNNRINNPWGDQLKNLMRVKRERDRELSIDKEDINRRNMQRIFEFLSKRVYKEKPDKMQTVEDILGPDKHEFIPIPNSRVKAVGKKDYSFWKEAKQRKEKKKAVAQKRRRVQKKENVLQRAIREMQEREGIRPARIPQLKAGKQKLPQFKNIKTSDL